MSSFVAKIVEILVSKSIRKMNYTTNPQQVVKVELGAELWTLLTVVISRSTQPSVPPGLVKDDQLSWKGKGMVYTVHGKTRGWQVKLRDPSTTRAIQEHFSSEISSLRGAISSVTLTC